MKPTPFLEQVYHMVVQLLNDQGHEELASQVSEIFELPEWIQKNNPLIKKGLVKVIKEYVRNNQKMLKYFVNRTQPEEEEEKVAARTRKKSQEILRQSVSPKVEAKVRTHKNKVESPLVTKVASPKQAANGKPAAGNSGWMAKFDKPKTLEQLNEMQKVNKHAIVEEEEVKQTKPSKRQKVKAKVESSDFQSQEDSFELQPKKKQKKEVKIEKKEAKKEEKKSKKKHREQEEEIEEEVEEEVVQKKTQTVKKTKEYYPAQVDNGPKKFFSRINADDVGPIREELRDNSFQAKAKFGQEADHWGQFGYDKLKDTRGDSFKKTKGKLKNRAFQGALMDINKINSIPIL